GPVALGLCVFFQAEDGIRDGHVTGVQTCALPISSCNGTECQSFTRMRPWLSASTGTVNFLAFNPCAVITSRSDGTRLRGGLSPRSEERRVGKECRSRWGGERERKSSRGVGS